MQHLGSNLIFFIYKQTYMLIILLHLLSIKHGLFKSAGIACTMSCFLVCSLQPCGHLLGKGWPLGSLVCYVLLCFCHFPICCPGSDVLLDCIDS